MKNVLSRYTYSIILLKQLVKTDFKLRYQGSVLGYLWSLLRPLFFFLILYTIFVKFLGQGTGIPNKGLYLLLGIILWNYFAEVTSGCVGAIVGRGDLLRKINFPKYVIIVSVSLSALVNLLLNFVIFAIAMAVTKVEIHWDIFLLLPILVELFVFAIGLGFLLSALFVKFRDVSYIWEVIMQAAFYATPILYLINSIPQLPAKILMLSPMAQLIQDARAVVVYPGTLTVTKLYDGNHLVRLGIILFVALLALAAGLYFRSRSKYFAEEI